MAAKKYDLSGNNKDGLFELVYHIQQHPSMPHPPPEFILHVDANEMARWKKDSSVAPALVVGSKGVLVNRTGKHSGILDHASQQELADAFGTTDFLTILKFMSEHGQLHPLGRHRHITEDGIISPSKYQGNTRRHGNGARDGGR